MALAFFRTCWEYSRNMGVQAWREGVMPMIPPFLTHATQLCLGALFLLP